MTGPRLHIDFETRSTCDLRKTGADKYSRDPETDIWCLVYRFDEEEPGVWLPLNWFPLRVADHVRSGGVVVAHNVHFELLIWNNLLVPRYGRIEGNNAIPELRIEQCDCTMIRAYAAALPGSLEELGTALKLPVEKDMDGKRLMQRMARPRKVNEDGSLVWWNDPDKVQRLVKYCVTDVVVETLADKKLPILLPMERGLMALDYRINRRGVQLDIPTIEIARQVVDRHKVIQNQRLTALTGYSVSSAQAVTSLRHWMAGRGIDVPDLTGPTVTRLLGQDNIPADVFEALQIREEVGRSSLAKLDAMVDSADDDGRARGLFAFTVASTN